MDADVVSCIVEFLHPTMYGRCMALSRTWHATIDTAHFWQAAYCHRWRAAHPAAVRLAVPWKALYRLRCPHRHVRATPGMVSHRHGNLWFLKSTRRVSRWNNGQQEAVAAHPVPYFEVKVKGGASVGFVRDAEAAVAGGDHIGWGSQTCGYHSDDGSVWADGSIRTHAAPYGTGDVLGCGVTPSRTVFFTKNGQRLEGVELTVGRHAVLPAVALHDKGDEALVNLGRDPFLFDVEAYFTSQGYGSEPAALTAEAT
eukprot:EG_transcript_19140